MKRFTFIVLIVCGLVFQGLWAEPPQPPSFKDIPSLPDGKQGERILSIIETFNSGSPDRLRRFLNEDCDERFRGFASTDGHIDAFMGMFQETGGIDFSGIRVYTPERQGETVVILKDRNYGNWRAFVLRFTDAPGYLIQGFSFNLARPPAGTVESPLTEEQVLQETQQSVTALIKKGVFSGTLLIAKGEKILLTMVGGEASKSFHVLNDIDTKFNLGSMNKMFTATAIVRLIEQGKLSLDDTIDKYIDETWMPAEITKKITIRHLLSHSSGLGSYFNDVYDKSSRHLFRKLDDYKTLIKDDKPAFEPGSRFQYSNTGMFLLGVIIEKVTGEDYFDHIRRVIYAPAGMNNTDCYEMDYPVENLAIGYSPDWKSPYKWQNNLYKHVIKGGPAGGGFSTVKDLHRFALALLAGKYVSKASLDMMWTDHLAAFYGFGFSVAKTRAGKTVGHGGGFSGINAKLDIYLDSGYIVSVMSNVDMGADPLANKISSFLARLKKM